MLKNVYEGLNAQKCVWRLKWVKMDMKVQMLKNVYEGSNAQKCIWRLKCSEMFMKARKCIWRLLNILKMPKMYSHFKRKITLEVKQKSNLSSFLQNSTLWQTHGLNWNSAVEKEKSWKQLGFAFKDNHKSKLSFFFK